MTDLSTHDGKAASTATSGLGDLVAVSTCLFCFSSQGVVEADQVKDFFFGSDSGTFTYLRCQNCQSLWLQSRPTGERLVKAYANYYTHSSPRDTRAPSGLRGLIRSAYTKSRFASSAGLADRIIDAGLKLLGRDNSSIDEQYRFAPRAPARILDYGCGSGEYLLRMQPFGHELYGVEYDPEVLAELGKRGIVVEDVSSITDDRWDKDFDFITLSHVLEHVPDPVALLQRLGRWLKQGGLLFIEVPHAGSESLAIFGRYWRGLEAPRHFALPSRMALMAALDLAGFKVKLTHINRNARAPLYDLSLGAAPPEERERLQAAFATARPETVDNAEYLTILAQKI